MQFTKTVPFHGDGKKALDFAASTLAIMNLRIIDWTNSSLYAEGAMHGISIRDPLPGASSILIAAGDGELRLEAELTGGKRVQRFVSGLSLGLTMLFLVLFGPGMGLLFGQLFGVGFGVPFAPGWKWLAFVWPLCIVPLLPCLILGPLIARKMTRMTEQTLEKLLENAATIGASQN